VIAKPHAYRVATWEEFLHTVDHVRHERRLTIRELSTQLGGTHQHLGKQLLGQVVPLAPFAWQLADALGYDIALIPRQPKERP
jgi:transcriptional regulator with XRE-family HTH domain